MIVRLWRGWTDAEQARTYEQLLTGQIAPAIMERNVLGLSDLTVLRRHPTELDPAAGDEFLTIMTFDDLEAVGRFTGGDPSASVVPTAARRLLARYDDHSMHYRSLARYRRP